MIKYLGSKRRLAPVLGRIAAAVRARTALDLFTGTTLVAQEFKRRGIHVTACDLATYSKVLADCYVVADAGGVDRTALADALAHLRSLRGEPGYVTRVFCEQARFFQPRNGARIDAIRTTLAREYESSDLFPILLTSLLEAADRVDSTTGQQMAYLKTWAPRAHRDLDLREPALLPGTGTSVRGDACELVDDLPRVDLAYLDPPYNQHSYRGNYHIWETLVRWDHPEHYGVACKRMDTRDPDTKSPFNSRRTMAAALADVIGRVRADVVVVSYNDESWITAEQMTGFLAAAGHEDVRVLGFDSARYVGARIGIFNRAGVRVGRVGQLRNTEYLFVAGPVPRVRAAIAAADSTAQLAAAPAGCGPAR